VTSALPDDAERTLLVGDEWLYQRKRGHRTSTDDVLVAARAVSLVRAAAGNREAWSGRPARYLDIGCGIGSVLLLTAHALRPPVAHGIEAQTESVAMLTQTLAELTPDFREDVRFEVDHGDLRQASPDRLGMFPLITGSPPYFPLGTGVEPTDPQRRACRFEVRGGVEAYTEAASRLLSDEGRFVMVAQTALLGRVDAELARLASTPSPLALASRLDFWMREDRQDPFLSVVELRRPACVTGGPATATETLAIRTARGTITEGYTSLRAVLGLTTKD
jgi:tRNA1Val (adenine37-N6)-methyltransferase